MVLIHLSYQTGSGTEETTVDRRRRKQHKGAVGRREQHLGNTVGAGKYFRRRRRS